MVRDDVCKNLAVYHKLDVDEIIEVGDVVMLDPATNTVTKAVANNHGEFILNARLIVGVVMYSDNYSKVPIVIDGGRATTIELEEIDCGTSEDKPEFILIEGGTAEQSMRELVQIAYGGEVPVNICGFVQLGDRLTISRHAGKAKAIDYIDNDYFKSRSIGKVIKFISKTQAKVLLDIE